jgi:hypothetical protein
MLKKISLILTCILTASNVYTITNFYQCQSTLSVFLQNNNIQYKNNLNSTFIILTDEQRNNKFLHLLKHNINVVWYKTENNKIMAVLKPGSNTDFLQANKMTGEGGKCNSIIMYPLKPTGYSGR